jgi:amino acid transporter
VPQLNRHIGLVGLTFIAVSGTIGSGWLFAPMLASQAAGPAAIVAWLIGAVAMGLLAATFAETSGVLPVASGIARLPFLTHGRTVSLFIG